ncbi:hypothetical protein CAPTEDRAFT_211308 [Capitella teleta]|uniref:Uncharacterized protein n=1 Tax=Capitella teleta TaxID=283909 RepID=R7TIE2_CAPTE|nr:hypothetical protein CAPTEDRAFT_211308 [Capitella teleta]|eukprot:ELT93613.1 hypothetical protein CAPTEDRAFT_211308 [Capitella teleta]
MTNISLYTISNNNEMKKGLKKREIEAENKWHKLGSVSTVHGLDKVIDGYHIAGRRWVWLCLISISMCLFAYQASVRLFYYFEYPINMRYDVVNNQSLVFPRVIICNQNVFK